jgi:hypothetical protein
VQDWSNKLKVKKPAAKWASFGLFSVKHKKRKEKKRDRERSRAPISFNCQSTSMNANNCVFPDVILKYTTAKILVKSKNSTLAFY